MGELEEGKGWNILILSQLFSILYVEMAPSGDILRESGKFWMHLEKVQAFFGLICDA